VEARIVSWLDSWLVQGRWSAFWDGKLANVPMGTFHFAENLWRKLLISRAGFGAEQWMQGVRLWKECLLSRGSTAHESRLDGGVMYFLRGMARAGFGDLDRTSALSIHLRRS
jgi:hypothetical protein